MNYFMNLSTRNKLLLSFGLIWIMFLVVIITAYRGLNAIVESEKELHNVRFQTTVDLREIRSYQNFNRAMILEMMLTKNISEQSAIEDTINKHSQIILDLIKDISKRDPDPRLQSQIKELNKIMEEYRKAREEQFVLIRNGKIDEAMKMGTSIQSERFEKIRTLALDMGDEESKKTDEQIALDQQNANSIILLLIIFGAIALSFSLLIVITLDKTIAKPLNSISKTAALIASGDLSVNTAILERNDEVGLLSSSFSQMVNKLRGSLKEIIEGTNLLGASSSEILAATTQVASGAAETATAISETTTTVEEVRHAAQLSNQKASRVSENAQQVVQIAQAGQTAVNETVSSMNDIKKQMESVANTIMRLSEQSLQIGGIVASVTDVADQSNLLAVNAAIEAAKAGEQGKGFVVVSDEIRRLALQSKQATIQVRNILTDIQKATSAAVMATEQTSKAVENGVLKSNEAGESIRKLAESSSKAVEAATLIVSSSQQQVIGMDQIGLAMTNINQAGRENAVSMAQSEKAAKDLNELGQKLKHLVAQYII